MNEILELAKKLSEKRSQVDNSEKYLKGLKDERDQLQFDLITALKEAGLKSIKTNEANYSLTTKKDVKVINEAIVMQELMKLGQYDEYVKHKLDTNLFKGYAKSVLDSTGEIIDGTELTETSYISIKTV